ncbi:MAG: lipopolysaccharide heptosyltransferase I [Burkholderiaceae bacterium]|nr:lipopolysaccharide heptosyltransferase I [Burkholderiaceae bacterium]
MPTAPRVLIVKTSSMGDVVHALPMASDIACAYPGATIDWVVEEAFAAIPRLHPSVTRVIAVALRRWRKRPASPATWREWRTAKAALRAQRYDRIVDCQGLIKSAWLARRARGPVAGPDAASAREPLAACLYAQRIRVPRALHAIERNRRIGAAALGYTAEGPPRFGLRPPALEGELRALVDGRDYAVLLTNASRATKLWPDERWAAVEAWLAARGLRSLLFWGSDEEGVRTCARAAGMRDAEVAPRAPLDAIAAALAGARVVVGLDTGLSHLAAAVGAPTVGIYCDYDPALVGITGDAPCESLGGVGLAPSADAVIAAIERVLAANAAR